MADQVLRNLNLSPEEMHRMTTCLQDPKFMELLSEYAKEIAEPANKDEADAYIKMIEERQNFSMEGKELVVPVVGFCVKTINKKTGKKVFINICHTNNIDKPTSVSKPDGSGVQWSIPYSLGPTHKDVDKAGGECEVHDFVVNGEAHERATKDIRFKRFLAETAIENIRKQRHVELDLNYVLPKLTYKGPSKNPKMQTVRKTSTETGAQSCSSKPPTQAQIASSTMNSMNSTDSRQQCESATNEVEPSYELIYRDDLDLSKFWTDQSVVNKTGQKPEAIVMRVSLPEVVAAGEVDLDVSGTEVSLHVPGKYKLKVNTTYPVDFANGRAQFDKNKRKLEVVMPTC